jgi:WD40 repeat protein
LQIEEALQVIDKVLKPIALSDIQERVFQGVWAGQALKLWDLESGKCLKTLTGHQNVIKSIAFHSEESIVVSGSLDETMKM